MVLIGLTGLKSSGKTEVSKIVEELTGNARESFAKPLKEVCKIVFGLTDEQLYGDEKEKMSKWSVTPRKIMQFVGTEMFREKLSELISNAEDIWILNMQNKINNNQDIIIDDVRFSNEAEIIRKFGGVIIQIKRDDINIIDTHKSEMFLEIKPDYVINNNGTLEDLRNEVQKIIPRTKADNLPFFLFAIFLVVLAILLIGSIK